MVRFTGSRFQKLLRQIKCISQVKRTRMGDGHRRVNMCPLNIDVETQYENSMWIR